MSRHIIVGSSVNFMSLVLLVGAGSCASAQALASPERVVCSTPGVEGTYVF
jgi:hypothetical protein